VYIAEAGSNFKGEKQMTPLPIQLPKVGVEKIVAEPLPML
jgi:hypothetical protein